MESKQKTLYPLSYPQKGIWYLEKMYPGTAIGNVAATLKVNLNLDYKLLDQAFQHYIKANDGVRIRVTEVNGEPMQYVSNYVYKKLHFLDFTGKDIRELHEWDEKETRIPFSQLDSDLYYFALIKVNDSMSGIYVKLHHIIADAWSIINMGNEIMQVYDALEDGRVYNNEPKPSYIDYLESERQYLDSERFVKDQAYWLEKFQDIPELTTLKEQIVSRFGLHSSRKTYLLPDKLCKIIRAHCEKNKISIFSLFMGALAIYYNRVKGQDEVVFGTPVLNRSNYKEKNTVGMFISTVPIRVHIDDTQTYNAFAETINKEWMGTLRHQKYPFIMLLKLLREKNPGLEKLYDIILSYQNAKFVKNSEKYYQEGRWHQNGCQTESLIIHINDREDDGNIVIDYDFWIDMFYENEIKFLHDQVVRLLWHAIDNPARKLSDIEMISESEKQKILFDFNDTHTDYPRNKTIHELFEEQVIRNPDAPCYIFEDQVITYGELNERANRVARFLREQGVYRDVVVGVMLPRSDQLIVAIMGILKAGGAYLPIDPNYPPDRVKLLVRDSRIKILLVHSSFPKDSVSVDHVISLDQSDWETYDGANLEHINTSEDLIYVMYTSGSTGTPKGVMVQHDGLVNYIFATKDVLNCTPSCRVLSVCNITFDIFVMENFTTLVHGGCVVLSNEEEQINPSLLKTLIMKHNVDIAMFTPSRMQMLLNDSQKPSFLQSVEVIVLGGEVLTRHLVDRLKLMTSAKIINFYGPTETTIAVTFKVITDGDINIGKPIANTQIYILTEHQKLLPIGIAGELCISGECLSRGYLFREEQTREKFIEHPFIKGKKLYRTGDMARWYPQGDIEYICRKDNQVKIKGFRVELGEIEREILQFEGVKETIVIDLEDTNGNKYLCAYMVYDNISISALRTHLMKQLPRYMVPTYFMKIENIPLTQSGKVNRKILPEPKVHEDLIKEYALPENSLEKELACVWHQLLQVKQIGREDDFFELGGDSLTVVQLISILGMRGITISTQDVYKYSTIRELAERIKFLELTYKKESPPREQYWTSSLLKEEEPLALLIENGMLPRLDSAAVTYVPKEMANLLEGVSEPVLYNFLQLEQGNIGLFAIPMSAVDIYNQNEHLIKLCTNVAKTAQNLGASVLSLTGLIPSATSYGHEVAENIRKTCSNIHITTGHSTTAASVVLSLERLLKESGRFLKDEAVVLIGAGSVGVSVAKLMLSVMPHPASIVLCDIRQKEQFLEAFREEIKDEHLFTGDISIALAEGLNLPERVYDCSIIIGATNVPDILNVERLRPGTMILDDSGPHCFSKESAVKRLLKNQDILFTEGGILESPTPISKRYFIPPMIKERIVSDYSQHLNDNNQITGCILSSLLTVKYQNIRTILGIASLQDCQENYQILKNLGYNGAQLHCDDFILPQELILRFRDMYGN